MAELRWLLLIAGALILVGVFWWTRREGSRPSPPDRRPRQISPESGSLPGPPASVGPDQPKREAPAAQRLVTIRLTAPGNSTFAGEALQAALEHAGLRHGLYGIYHRHDPVRDGLTRFSVASLVEPGSFDPARFATDRFPGVSFFLAITPGSDNLASFDDMLATARGMAGRLEGDLLDERGSRLSLQRERYLREEVIQLTRQYATAS
jgi:cell division protein ZipA